MANFNVEQATKVDCLQEENILAPTFKIVPRSFKRPLAAP